MNWTVAFKKTFPSQALTRLTVCLSKCQLTRGIQECHQLLLLIISIVHPLMIPGSQNILNQILTQTISRSRKSLNNLQVAMAAIKVMNMLGDDSSVMVAASRFCRSGTSSSKAGAAAAATSSTPSPALWHPTEHKSQPLMLHQLLRHRLHVQTHTLIHNKNKMITSIKYASCRWGSSNGIV